MTILKLCHSERRVLRAVRNLLIASPRGFHFSRLLREVGVFPTPKPPPESSPATD
jgi:hypothetical protein